MKAVVLHAQPDDVEVVADVPEPDLGNGDVRIAVSAVGVCGSDLSLIRGSRSAPMLPWVLGHETVGRVVALGAGVRDRHVGQRVVVEPNIACLRCGACRRGVTSACPHRRSLGFSEPGTLAEQVSVPAAFAWPLPEGCSDADAVCVEPLAVAFAALRRAEALGVSLQRCLIVGAGAQGTMLALALTHRGLTPAVIEPDEGRLFAAQALGARRCSPHEEDFSVVFETSGAPAALSEAVSRAGRLATVILVGQSTRPSSLVTQEVVQRQLTLRGSLIYDHPDDFAATLRAVADGMAPSRILQACYPFEQAPAAFQAARTVPGKTWIRFDAAGSTGG